MTRLIFPALLSLILYHSTANAQAKPASVIFAEGGMYFPFTAEQAWFFADISVESPVGNYGLFSFFSAGIYKTFVQKPETGGGNTPAVWPPELEPLYKPEYPETVEYSHFYRISTGVGYGDIVHVRGRISLNYCPDDGQKIFSYSLYTDIQLKGKSKTRVAPLFFGELVRFDGEFNFNDAEVEYYFCLGFKFRFFI